MVCALLPALLALAGPREAHAQALQVQRFDYSGDYVNYTVPAGVTALRVTLTGATGGDGSDAIDSPATTGGQGAPGGRITARIPVTSGETLRLFAGGGGGHAFRLTGGAHGPGGAFTGGAGGTGVLSDAGGGGGGASSISRGDQPVIVAGGGGGGGGEAANPPDKKDYITGGYGGNGGSPPAGGERSNGRWVATGGGGGTNSLWTGGNGGTATLGAGAGGGGGGGRMGGEGGDAGSWVITLGFVGGMAGGGGGGGSNWTDGSAAHVTHGVGDRFADRNGSISIAPVINTTTTLTSTASASSTASPATFTATVTPSDPTGVGGTVDFDVDSFFTGRGNYSSTPCQNVPLRQVNGQWQATCSSSTLDIGSHIVKARYSGTIERSPSQSGQLQHDVGAATTTRFLDAPATAPAGGKVTFRVAVDGSLGRGRVEWSGGNYQTHECPGTLEWSSQAGTYVSTCAMTLSSLPGNTTITARYRGNLSSVPLTGPSQATHPLTVAFQPDYMTVEVDKPSPRVGEPVRVTVRYRDGATGAAEPSHEDWWEDFARVSLGDGGTCTGVDAVSTSQEPYPRLATATCTPSIPGPLTVTARWTNLQCPTPSSIRGALGSNPFCTAWTGWTVNNGVTTGTGECQGQWVGEPGRREQDCTLPGYHPTGSTTINAIGPLARISLRSLTDRPVTGQAIVLAADGFDAAGNALGEVDPSRVSYRIADEPCFGRACVAGPPGAVVITGTTAGPDGPLSAGLTVNVETPWARYMSIEGPERVPVGTVQSYLARISIATGEEFYTGNFEYRLDGEPVPGCNNPQYFNDGYTRLYPCDLRIMTPGRHALTVFFDGPPDFTGLNRSTRTAHTRIITAYGPKTAIRLDGPAQLAAGQAGAFDVRSLDVAGTDLGADNDATLSITPVTGGSADGASCSGRTCSATRAGTYRVRAQNGSHSDERTVEVVPARAARLESTPSTAKTVEGGNVVFRLTAYDAHGNSRGDVTRDPSVQSAFTDSTAGTCTGTQCSSTVPGMHVVRFSYRQDAGDEPLTTTVPFEVTARDRTPPAVSLDFDSVYTGDNTPHFAGNAGTDEGDAGTVTVRVYGGDSVTGTPVQELTGTRSGARYGVDAAALADGVYTVQASQTDAAGNEGRTGAHTFTVDTTRPPVTLEGPSGRTNDATPSFAGDAGTRPNDSETVTVRIYSGAAASGTPVQELTSYPSNGRWSIDASALAEGTYTAQAFQHDSIGNIGRSNTRTFTVDTTRPGVSVDGLPARVRDNTPTVSGNAGSAPNDMAHIAVVVWSGTNTLLTPLHNLAQAPSAGRWSLDLPTLADGTYSVAAWQMDDLGNSGYSDAATFAVDTTGPAVTLDALPARTRDATPTFAGGAGTATGDRATVTVEVFSGSAASGSPVQTLQATHSGGRWSIDASALPDGTYTARAAQADDLGNSAASAPQTFTVDSAKPSVGLDALAARTADNTPTLSGDAGAADGDSPSVTVNVYRGEAASGTPVQSVTAPRSGGRFTVDAALLPDGTYTAQAAQSDDVGNSDVSAPRTFTVDTAAPAVSLDALAARIGDATPALSGDAGAATGDAAAVTVHVYSGDAASGSPVQTLTATRAGGRWSVDATALSDGTYTARATQFDDVGNSGTSAPRTFTVDTAKPVVTLDAPAARTGDATPTLAGDAGSAAGDATTVTVRVYGGDAVSGAPVQTLTATRTGGRFSVDAASLPDGTYTAQAAQSDDVGNGDVSAPRMFIVDTGLPAVTLDELAARTADSTPALAGGAGDGAGDAATVTVKVYGGDAASGSPLQTLSAMRSGGRWSVDAAALSDGTYTAQAEQSDDVGNRATSAARTFTIDTAKPAVTLDALAARIGDATPTLAGHAGSAAGDGATVTVRVYSGDAVSGSPVQTLDATRTGGRWSVDAANLPDGTYTAQATQADDVGNSDTSAARTFTVDTAKPAVTLDALDARTADATPALAGDAGSAAGDAATVTVRVYSGDAVSGSPVQTLTATRAGGRWSVDAANLPDGTYTAQATQADDVGNSDTSAARTFTVDTAKPAVTLDALDARTGDSTPTFAGDAGAATGDAEAVTVRVHDGDSVAGSPVQTLTATRAGSRWSVDAANLPDGVYTAQAAQSDDVGNSDVSAARTFTVDTAGPAVGLDALDARTTDTTPTFAGDAGTRPGDGDRVVVRVFSGDAASGTPTQTIEVTRAGGRFSIDASALPDGVYTAQAAQYDDVGNGATSAARTFTVDTAKPAVTLDPLPARTRDDTPTLAGGAGDATGDGHTVTVRVYDGHVATGSPVQTLRATRSGARYSVEAADLPDGTYTANASQSDDLGNSDTSAGRTFTVDTDAPDVTLTSPTGTTEDTTPALSGSAGTAAGDEGTVSVRVFAGSGASGAVVQTRPATRSADGGYSVEAAPALAPGVYTALATQSDDVGNEGSSAPLTFTIAAPRVPQQPGSRLGPFRLTGVAADRYCIAPPGERVPGAGANLTIRYRLSHAARMTFSLQRRTSPGDPPPRGRCPQYRPGGPGPSPVSFGEIGSEQLDGASGENFATIRPPTKGRPLVLRMGGEQGKRRVTLGQIVRGSNLPPGRYRVLVQGVRTADGTRSWAYAVKFWVLRPAAGRRTARSR